MRVEKIEIPNQTAQREKMERLVNVRARTIARLVDDGKMEEAVQYAKDNPVSKITGKFPPSFDSRLLFRR